MSIPRTILMVNLPEKLTFSNLIISGRFIKCLFILFILKEYFDKLIEYFNS